jgi:RNA recognition motif-containing protein
MLTCIVGCTDKPDDDSQIRGDAFKTLFVARLSYDAKEADLEREFGRFGPIERVGHLRALGDYYCVRD